MSIFFLWNLYTVFGEQIAIFYQFLSQGAVKKKLMLSIYKGADK